jgi:hypothetical protein
MSADQRLRQGLAANADRIVAGLDASDVAASLTAVRAAGHRRRRRRTFGIAAMTGAVAVAVVALVVLLVPRFTSTHSTPVPLAGPAAIAGTWRTAVATDAKGEAGAWTITLFADGRAVPDPPAGFAGSSEPFAFSLQGQVFRTDAFSNDACADLPAGRYAVLRAGNTMTFIKVSDDCAVRASLFAGQQWSAGP